MFRSIALTRSGGRIVPRGDGKLVVQHEHIAFEVDPRTGLVTPTARITPEPPSLSDPEVALGRADLRLSERETTEGPSSRILAPEGAELAVFAGTTRQMVIAGHVFAGIVSLADRSREVVAGVLGGRERQVLRVEDGGAAAAAGRDYVAVAGAAGAIHVFRTVEGALSRVTLGAPQEAVSSMHAEGGTLYAVVGAHLLAIDVAQLPRVAPSSMPATYEPVIPPVTAAPDPARVAFVLASSIGLDHPRFGRIVIPSGPQHPAVAAGDMVFLEDVFEELPGIFRARAFRTATGQASTRPPPVPLVCDAPSVVERVTPWNARAGSSARIREGLVAELGALAERHRFEVAPLLTRLLDAADEDAVVRRWLDRLGFEVEVRCKCIDWASDPFCLGFASLGNGDAYCLYPYPPAIGGPSWEPPVVEFLHETNEAELRARTFDEFFSDFLAERIEGGLDGDREIVDLVVARFGLPPPARIERPAAPEWLPRYSTDDDLLEKAAALEGEDELVAAERLLVSRWLGGDTPSGDVRARLERIYERLGWTFPVAALRAAGS